MRLANNIFLNWNNNIWQKSKHTTQHYTYTSHTHARTHTHTYTHARMHVYTYIHTYARARTHTHTHMDACTYIHTYARAHTYTHTHTHTHTHTGRQTSMMKKRANNSTLRALPCVKMYIVALRPQTPKQIKASYSHLMLTPANQLLVMGHIQWSLSNPGFQSATFGSLVKRVYIIMHLLRLN
jgi:hypothetical protein